MEVFGIVIGAVALVLTGLSLIAIWVVERLKQARLEIEPSRFEDDTVPWTFAAVRVFNRASMPRGFGWLTRSAAEACEATIEFRKKGSMELAFGPVPARWSSSPQPVTEAVVPTNQFDVATMTLSASSALTTVKAKPMLLYSAARAAESRRWDVAAGPKGEEIAVAVLKADGHAYGWGAESQAFPDFGNPAWKLDHGVYEVTVRVRGSGVEAERTFILTFTSGDFEKFSLTTKPQ
jgi:hypothetical protein